MQHTCVCRPMEASSRLNTARWVSAAAATCQQAVSLSLEALQSVPGRWLGVRPSCLQAGSVEAATAGPGRKPLATGRVERHLSSEGHLSCEGARPSGLLGPGRRRSRAAERPAPPRTTRSAPLRMHAWQTSAQARAQRRARKRTYPSARHTQRCGDTMLCWDTRVA